MIEQACYEHNISIDGSYMIGDALSDMQTGVNAGLHNILVLTGYGKLAQRKCLDENVKIDFIATNLSENPQPGPVSLESAYYILAKSRLSVVKADYAIVEEFKGEKIIGKSYRPVFDYYNNDKTKNIENGFKVYGASFVTVEDGTGIVHIAPAFGEDDYNLGKVEGVPLVQHVNMEGKFVE